MKEKQLIKRYPNLTFDCKGCEFRGRFNDNAIAILSKSPDSRLCRHPKAAKGFSGSREGIPSHAEPNLVYSPVNIPQKGWDDQVWEVNCSGVEGCDMAVPQEMNGFGIS